jgi:hypothetical protein
VALAGGGVLALVLGGGDDGKKTAPMTGATRAAPTRGAGVDHTAPSRTETTTRRAARPPKRDGEAIERAVVTFVEAAEQGDSSRACAQLVRGAGKQLPSCATALGIDPRTVPTSGELDFRVVSVSGETGKATLSNGSTFSLERSAGRWLIAGLRA